MDPDRRRSLIVNLTVVGLGGAVIFGPMLVQGKEVRRNQYKNLADCERDYTASQCESPGGSGGGGGGGGYWRGPQYYADRGQPEARNDPGPGRQGGAAVGVEKSVRGGFGKFGRIMRAIG